MENENITWRGIILKRGIDESHKYPYFHAVVDGIYICLTRFNNSWRAIISGHSNNNDFYGSFGYNNESCNNHVEVLDAAMKQYQNDIRYKLTCNVDALVGFMVI